MHMEHQHHHNKHAVSEVIPTISYNQREIVIELKDKDGKSPELNVSHEKHMHLIIIRSDLEDYYNLHPEVNREGQFIQKINLPKGNYRVFVDIDPEGLDYTVEAIHLSVDHAHETSQQTKLISDTNFTKTINGQTVKLIMDG